MRRVVSKHWSVAVVGFVAAVWIGSGPTCKALEFPGPTPGRATARLDGEQLILQNAVISATWSLAADRFELVEVVDRVSGDTVRARAAEAFVVTLAGGRSIKASELRPDGKPSLEKLQPSGDSVRLAGRFAGWKATVPLVSSDDNMRVEWQAVLRDQSNYVRQQVAISAVGQALPIKRLTLIDLAAPGARTIGTVDGSPVFAGKVFFACEHPMSQNLAEEGRIICSLPRFRPVEPGGPLAVTSVFGVVPSGQLRRAFLYYLERERARPYCPFVYYISWFDIAYAGRKMDEGQCLDRIGAFGDELAAKRGVKLDAFVFDSGWDDNQTLWQFNDGFPNGFAPLQTAAAKYGAVLGTWISPWGGYGNAKAERLKYGKTQGFETNARGFSLGGAKYYERVRAVCIEHMREYGVGYFKFDGVGKGNLITGPGEEFGPDIEALLRLIGDLRRIRPDVFINTTTGTWPSPYWLWHSDSVWRAGGDCGWDGPGSARQQWMTYRDGVGYQLRTRRGPLYPLNSLKFQSVICAQLGLATKISNDLKDLIDDIRMAAGSGTQVQEFFVTPKMMPPEAWDAVAEAIGWVRQNTDVLVDTHGIGGDPGKGEVYGFASWSPRKGIFVLRNPTDAPATFNLDVQTAFELPPNAPQRYLAQSPWKQDEGHTKITLQAGRPHTFELAPFEALVLEALPVK